MPPSAPAPWRVVLIEDNPDTRRFFEDSVRGHPALALVAAFDAIGPALDWFEREDADLLLTDLGLPDGSGLDVLRAVGARHPRCDMLVISMFGDEEHVVASIEAGAVGYVHKDSNAAGIADTLLAVKNGASPISPMVARGLLARLRSRPPADPPAVDAEPAVPLTPREREVLELIARGYSYAEIAQLGGVTHHTVQGHIKNLYGKLAVHSRSEAVFEASRLGLIRSMPLAR
ncbi:MAG: response regulator transcription factor [Burkholderiales bacterium]|nr:response regulator transcription factor [Burkholderiales bacterium]